MKYLPKTLQTREDWKYVAMVIDRLQLYIFFIVTTAGTVGILMDAPHIFEYVDQDRIIEIYRESKRVRTWSSRGLIEMVNSIANATIISKRGIETEENNENCNN